MLSLLLLLLLLLIMVNYHAPLAGTAQVSHKSRPRKLKERAAHAGTHAIVAEVCNLAWRWEDVLKGTGVNMFL